MIYLLLFFLELPPPLRLEECLLSTTFIIVNIRNTFQHTIYNHAPTLPYSLSLCSDLATSLARPSLLIWVWPASSRVRFFTLG